MIRSSEGASEQLASDLALLATPGNSSTQNGSDIVSSGVNTTTCSGSLATLVAHFAAQYGVCHGYAALVVCAIGIALNAANVLVLTQKKMRSPVNALLTLLAVAQLLLLAVYVPFDVIVFVLPDKGLPQFTTVSRAKAAYLLLYVNASVMLHMISSWTMVVTAAFRFVSVQFSVRSSSWCSYRRAAAAAGAIVILCAVCGVPNGLRYRVEVIQNGGQPDPWYTIGNSEPYERADSAATQLNYWLYALAGKLLPSALLLVLTALLVGLLRKALSRQRALHSNSLRSHDTSARSGGDGGGGGKNHARTTRMLLAVVVLFLCVELPHGMLVIAASADRCYLKLYNTFGDLIDLFTLVVFSINFVLYCTTSRQFRQHFAERLNVRSVFRALEFQRVKIIYGTTLVANEGSGKLRWMRRFSRKHPQTEHGKAATSECTPSGSS